MYEHEVILDQYKVLGVDVLIKEHQFPDNNEVSYFAFFKLGDEQHMVKWETVAGLRKKVSLIIHKHKHEESEDEC
jgi:hypothetical protein